MFLLVVALSLELYMSKSLPVRDSELYCVSAMAAMNIFGNTLLMVRVKARTSSGVRTPSLFSSNRSKMNAVHLSVSASDLCKRGINPLDFV